MTEKYQLRTEKLQKLSNIVGSGEPLPQPVVLLLCGSFNPIHKAHIAIFDSAKRSLDGQPYTLESTTGTPSANHPIKVVAGFVSPVADAYKKSGLKPLAIRSAIISAAIADHPSLEVDMWEGVREEYTRTYFVMEHMEKAVGEFYAKQEPEVVAMLAAEGVRVRVMLACGADLFASFFRPGWWSPPLLLRLLECFRIIIIGREGFIESEKQLLAKSRGTVLQVREGDVDYTVDFSKYTFYFGSFEVPDATCSTFVRDALKPGTDPIKAREAISNMVHAPAAVDLIMKYYGPEAA